MQPVLKRKREINDTGNASDQPLKKRVKFLKTQLELNSVKEPRVMVLSYENALENNVQLYSFPKFLIDRLQPLIEKLKDQATVNSTVEKDVLKKVVCSEDFRALCQNITHLDLWFNILDYWQSKGLVKWIQEDVFITNIVNLSMFIKIANI
jgi:hypothetical protein